MARIGNETRLVLKLAAERAKHQEELMMLGGRSSDYQQGYTGALDWYERELTNIKLELES